MQFPSEKSENIFIEFRGMIHEIIATRPMNEAEEFIGHFQVLIEGLHYFAEEDLPILLETGQRLFKVYRDRHPVHPTVQ